MHQKGTSRDIQAALFTKFFSSEEPSVLFRDYAPLSESKHLGQPLLVAEILKSLVPRPEERPILDSESVRSPAQQATLWGSTGNFFVPRSSMSRSDWVTAKTGATPDPAARPVPDSQRESP